MNCFLIEDIIGLLYEKVSKDAAFDCRSPTKRRCGEDRRKVYNLDFFNLHFERRVNMIGRRILAERRKRWKNAAKKNELAA